MMLCNFPAEANRLSGHQPKVCAERECGEVQLVSMGVYCRVFTFIGIRRHRRTQTGSADVVAASVKGIKARERDILAMVKLPDERGFRLVFGPGTVSSVDFAPRKRSWSLVCNYNRTKNSMLVG